MADDLVRMRATTDSFGVFGKLVEGTEFRTVEADAADRELAGIAERVDEAPPAEGEVRHIGPVDGPPGEYFATTMPTQQGVVTVTRGRPETHPMTPPAIVKRTGPRPVTPPAPVPVTPPAPAAPPVTPAELG